MSVFFVLKGNYTHAFPPLFSLSFISVGLFIISLCAFPLTSSIILLGPFLLLHALSSILVSTSFPPLLSHINHTPAKIIKTIEKHKPHVRYPVRYHIHAVASPVGGGEG